MQSDVYSLKRSQLKTATQQCNSAVRRQHLHSTRQGNESTREICYVLSLSTSNTKTQAFSELLCKNLIHSSSTTLQHLFTRLICNKTPTPFLSQKKQQNKYTHTYYPYLTNSLTSLQVSQSPSPTVYPPRPVPPSNIQPAPQKQISAPAACVFQTRPYRYCSHGRPRWFRIIQYRSRCMLFHNPFRVKL